MSVLQRRRLRGRKRQLPPASNATRWGLAAVATTAALAAVNLVLAHQAEARHPPRGEFLDIDGVRLHYRDIGQGSPVVLIHGNVVTGEDFELSGLAGELARQHRVIIFDRPGFGYSNRPLGRSWTAAAQAGLLHAAWQRLGVELPVVLGHSLGTQVALEAALRHPADIAGLVLVAGYYFPTPRADVAMLTPVALPGPGTLLRYTVWPLLSRATMPLFTRAVFAPAPVPERFRRGFAADMAVRPLQLTATSVDGTLINQAARELQPRLANIRMPVVILAGSGDQIVSPTQSERLAGCIGGSGLRMVPGGGHMLHHLATDLVATAVEQVRGKGSGPA